ncbi:aldolase [Metabacillus sp. 84]|uniref:aldolase n=1 Tax=unclassified Metabacillus TaxID=2675274 RepID=UPI003CEDA5DC
MLKVKEKLIYTGFGFTIQSDLLLPELSSSANRNLPIDINIYEKDLTYLWRELSDNEFGFTFDNKDVYFKIPDLAIFGILNGHEIQYSPIRETDFDMIRLFVLGTCMGVILMQKKILPLHGSAIEIEGKAYCIVGESGAGKSTLASYFLKSGYKLLSDDVIPITMQNGYPYVTPSYPQQKLWQESLNYFGMKKEEYKSIFGRTDKFSVPVSSNFITQPLPLGGIIELVKTDNHLSIESMEGFNRFKVLLNHTYRNFLIPSLNLTSWHFSYSAAILNQVGVYSLNRPISRYTAPELAMNILNIIGKENVCD